MLPETEPDDLRSTLESAFDDETNEPTGSVETPREEPVQPTPVPGDEPAAPEGREGEGDRGDGRTPSGRFAKKDDVASPEKAAEVTPPVRDPFVRAPQSWKPGAREAWGTLPAPVREEVYRREREAHQVMSESAQARQVSTYVSQLQQQYAPALQAEGVDALTATNNLMNLASRLRFGTPTEKAGLAAQIIRTYGVDIATLDQVLSGAAPDPTQQPQPQMLQDPRVDQLMAQLNQAQQQRQQQVYNGAVREVEGFGSDKEFFDDVRGEMADMMELAAKRGVDMSLEQAYERACSLHPQISQVMAARAAASAAGNARASTQRAKHAASSVRGTPSGVSTPQANDLRGAIEEAIEQVGGR